MPQTASYSARCALLGLAFACSSRGEDTSALPGRDSAGVATRHIGSLDSIASPEWATRTLFTGVGMDSAPLGRFVDARFLLDSSLVATRGDQLLRFSPQGQLLETLGRGGNGPGEYGLILTLGIAEDGTLLIGDLTSPRVTELNPLTHRLRTVPSLGKVTASYEKMPLALLPSGHLIGVFWQERPNRDTPGLTHGGFERDSAPLQLYDSTGTFLRELGVWPGLERARVSLGRLPPPFARTTLVQSRGRMIAISVTDSLDVSLFADTALILRLIGPTSTRRPPAGALAAWEATIRQDFPDMFAEYLESIQGAPAVPALPGLGGIGLDNRGNLWLGTYTVPGDTLRVWTVFTPEGAPLGHLNLPTPPARALPGHRELLDVYGDRLVLLREAPDGAPYLEVRQFGPGTARQ